MRIISELAPGKKTPKITDMTWAKETAEDRQRGGRQRHDRAAG